MIIKSRTLIMETFKKLISVEIQFIFQLLKLCVLSTKIEDVFMRNAWKDKCQVVNGQENYWWLMISFY